jgi:LAO/AO transport system kinase
VAPVVRTVASTGQGVEGLVGAISDFTAWLSRDGHLRERREQQWRERLIEMVRAAFMRGLHAHGLEPGELAEHARRIAARQEDPFATAAEMVNAILAGSHGERRP